MQRTNVIELRPTKGQKKILKEMMCLSSCVYNMTNYIVRNQFFKKEKISSFYDLQQKLQLKDDYQMLGRSYALPRIQIYGETNSARFKLIKSKNQKCVGLPKYYKNRKTNTTIPSYLVIDNSQYSVKTNHVEIPMSRLMRKKYNPKQTFKIKYNGILNHKGNQQRGQIHFKDNKFYMYQSVEVKDTQLVKSKVKVGLDLGAKRIFGLYINNGYEKVIGRSRFFKQWKYWTRLISKEQQYLSTFNKKVSNNLLKLYRKRTKYQNNLFNNLTLGLFRKLNKNKVSEMFVGDVTNIRNGNKKKVSKSHLNKIGRKGITKSNQMINNYWSFDKLYQKLQNKSEEYGIALTKVDESYTSMTCPKCGFAHENNKQDRDFVCKSCGYCNDRDIVGAKNIYTKGMYGSLQNIHWNEIVPLGVSV